MVKTSIELIKKAKTLIAEAKKIENKEVMKIGKIILDFYKKDLIKDVELKKILDEFYVNNLKKKNDKIDVL